MPRQARRAGATIDDIGMDYEWEQTLERLLARQVAKPDDVRGLETITELAELVERNRFDINLWWSQNECYQLLRAARPEKERQAAEGSAEARRWLALFARLCEAVRIVI